MRFCACAWVVLDGRDSDTFRTGREGEIVQAIGASNADYCLTGDCLCVRLSDMTPRPLLARPAATFFLLIVLCLFAGITRAEWQRDDTTIAWRDAGGNVVWKFSFDPQKGKPFFHPISTGGPAFTNFKPEDHPWHYGLWFSWKYINKVNYWEEDRETGKAEGSTRWSTPEIEAKPDGSAVIKFDVTYTHPSGRVDMTEQRNVRISAPQADGSYAIDWRSSFTAGKVGAILDRTPMPDEPDGKVNGGYAGLGLRMASSPLGYKVVSSIGPVNRFVSDRARPAAPAVACNFTDGDKDIGGIAIFSDPANSGENAPWYIINSVQMRFVCAAVLAPKIITLPADGKMDLHYQIAVRPKAWTPEALQEGQTEWMQTSR